MSWYVDRTEQGTLHVTEHPQGKARGPYDSPAEAWDELRRLERHNNLAGLGLVCLGVTILWVASYFLKGLGL